jgi:hypothetical protein
VGEHGEFLKCVYRQKLKFSDSASIQAAARHIKPAVFAACFACTAIVVSRQRALVTGGEGQIFAPSRTDLNVHAMPHPNHQ